jgi:hypothetical protein
MVKSFRMLAVAVSILVAAVILPLIDATGGQILPAANALPLRTLTTLTACFLLNEGNVDAGPSE